jgi:hypothetical protein
MVLTLKRVGNNFYLRFVPCQGDGHHVEAHRVPGEAFGLEIIIRQAAQPALLGYRYRLLGAAEPGTFPGLDLHDHQNLALPGDEIDFA